MEATSEQRAVWHLLQLSEMGWGLEPICQFIASYILSMDANSTEFFATRTEIQERVLDLLMDPAKVWEDLLPGPSTKFDYSKLMMVESPAPQPGEDEYRISIIVNPSVKHDEETDLIRFNQRWTGESPLNAAQDVIDWIEELAKQPNQFPEEEMCAWITHISTIKHWIMTWDQAQAIKLLDETKEKLENLSADLCIDWDEQFQGISDMMSIAGDEYIAGR